LETDNVEALAIDPMRPSILYAGTANAGVFRSADGALTWQAFSTGLTTTFINALAIDPDTPSIVYAGTGGGGVFSIQLVGSCVGDCSDDASVTVDELVTMVTIALGNASVTACRAGDGDRNGQITVDEIITAVTNALNGCPAAS